MMNGVAAASSNLLSWSCPASFSTF